MVKRDGPRHDLKVDPSPAFEGVKVKSLANGYNASFMLPIEWISREEAIRRWPNRPERPSPP